MAGNGQDELVEAITGLRKPAAGSVILNGEDVTHAGVPRCGRPGSVSFPGDRQRLSGWFSVSPSRPTRSSPSYHRKPFSRGWWLTGDEINRWARQAIDDYDIRTPSEDVPCGNLSGGNQQKAVVAREFGQELKVLVLDQPTRGLDVGSIEFIHRQVIEMRGPGDRDPAGLRRASTRYSSYPTGSR